MEEKIKVKLENKYFTLYEIVEGVYGAIEKDNNTGSNAGLIDMGNFTVMFDTFLNIDAAKELKKISEQLTGKAPCYIINSHSHTDHFIGNCLFSHQTPIISSQAVRDAIAKMKEAFLAERDLYEPRIDEIEDILKDRPTAENIQDLNNELQFLRNLVKPDVEIQVPNMTIDKEITLYGSKRSLRLITFDKAHSKGDVIGYLPEDKVCFTGDLLFNKSHPWLGSGDPEQFIEVLENLLNYDICDFVPGHGPIADMADINSEIQYIKEIINLVKAKNSVKLEDYSINDLSPMFSEWKSLCFSWNINFLIERMKKKNKLE